MWEKEMEFLLMLQQYSDTWVQSPPFPSPLFNLCVKDVFFFFIFVTLELKKL